MSGGTGRDQVGERLLGSAAEAPDCVWPVSGSLSEGLHPARQREKVADEVVHIMRRPFEGAARRAESSGPGERRRRTTNRLDDGTGDAAVVEIVERLGSESIRASHVASSGSCHGAPLCAHRPSGGTLRRRSMTSSLARRPQPLAPGALDEYRPS